MQQTCQRGGSHGSEARIEGKGVEEAVEEGKKVRGFRGNHTKITETCLFRRRTGHHLQAWRIDLQFHSIRKVGSGTRIGDRNACVCVQGNVINETSQ